MKLKTDVLFWLTIVFVVFAVAGCWFAVKASAQPTSKTIQSVLPAVVPVEADWGQRTYYGTATHLEDGYYLTARHLVVNNEGNNPDEVRVGGEVAVLIAVGDSDPMLDDWAVLKSTPLDVRVECVPAIDSGEWIFRIGNDNAWGIVISIGIVSDVNDSGLRPILTPLESGASGGGVFNEAGQLVGIVTRKVLNNDSYGFFLPFREEMVVDIATAIETAKQSS